MNEKAYRKHESLYIQHIVVNKSKNESNSNFGEDLFKIM